MMVVQEQNRSGGNHHDPFHKDQMFSKKNAFVMVDDTQEDFQRRRIFWNDMMDLAVVGVRSHWAMDVLEYYVDAWVAAVPD